MGKWLINRMKKLKKIYRYTFIFTFVLGFLVHAYKFLNTLPNHDSLYNFYDSQNTIESGRWLLSGACGITSYFDLPWIIGIVSIFLLAVVATIMVSIFEIKNPVVACITGGLIISFPSITETLFFEFTADGYFIAMLMAVLVVKLLPIYNKKKSHVFFAMILVCCTCGIYQSYVSFAIILSLIYLAWYLLKKECEMKEIRYWILSQLVVYIGGMVLFLVVWKILLRVQHLKIGTNQGVGNMGVSISTIVLAIPTSIKNFIRFFLEWNTREYGWTLYGALNVIFLMIFLATILRAIICSEIYKRRWNFLFFIVAIICIPFVASMWCFVTPDISYRPMMLGGLVCIYIFVAIISDSYLRSKTSSVVGILLSVIIFNNAISANIGYFYMNQCYEKSYAIGSEMIGRIHLMDVDTSKYPLVVIGNILPDVMIDELNYGNRIPMLGQLIETNFMFDEEHTVLFLKNVFDNSIHRASKNVRQQISSNPEVLTMGNWPASNSIAIIKDVIVIKLQDERE